MKGLITIISIGALILQSCSADKFEVMDTVTEHRDLTNSDFRYKYKRNNGYLTISIRYYDNVSLDFSEIKYKVKQLNDLYNGWIDFKMEQTRIYPLSPQLNKSEISILVHDTNSVHVSHNHNVIIIGKVHTNRYNNELERAVSELLGLEKCKYRSKQFIEDWDIEHFEYNLMNQKCKYGSLSEYQMMYATNNVFKNKRSLISNTRR